MNGRTAAKKKVLLRLSFQRKIQQDESRMKLQPNYPRAACFMYLTHVSSQLHTALAVASHSNKVFTLTHVVDVGHWLGTLETSGQKMD